jgi:hypothetical protein
MHLRKQYQPSSKLTNYAEKACDDLMEPTVQVFRQRCNPHPDRKPALGLANCLRAAEGDRVARSAKLRGSHKAARR